MMYYNNYGGNFSEGIREGIKNSFRKGSSLTRLIYINCGIFLALKLIYIMMLLLGKGEEFYPTLLEWIGVPADPEYLLSRGRSSPICLLSSIFYICCSICYGFIGSGVFS